MLAHVTLQVIDSTRKENFSLKLKIYFLEERLAKLAPDQVDLALKENIELKVEFQTVRQELKRYKKLLIEAEGAIESLKKEKSSTGGSSDDRERELEREMRRMKEEWERERQGWEAALAEKEAEARQARERERKNKAGEWDGEDARVRRSLVRVIWRPVWLTLPSVLGGNCAVTVGA
jgi:DNA repair exonuclease SbcCD ATPase subunit